MQKTLKLMGWFLVFLFSVSSVEAVSWSRFEISGDMAAPEMTVFAVSAPRTIQGSMMMSTGENITGRFFYSDGRGWFLPTGKLYSGTVDGSYFSNFTFGTVGNIKMAAGWSYTDGSGVVRTEVASKCVSVFNKATGVNFEPTNVRVNAGSTKTKVLAYNGKALGGIWGGRTLQDIVVGKFCQCSGNCSCRLAAGSRGGVQEFNIYSTNQSSFPTSYTLTLSCSGPTGSYCDFDFGNMNVLWRDETSGICTGTLPPLPNQSSPSPTPTPRTIWRSCTFCDANRDGKVCRDDLTILNSCYGYDRNSKSGSRLNSTCNAFDMNYDGKINIQDLTRCGGVCMACISKVL